VTAEEVVNSNPAVYLDRGSTAPRIAGTYLPNAVDSSATALSFQRKIREIVEAASSY
jgi:hypothetical protein